MNSNEGNLFLKQLNNLEELSLEDLNLLYLVTKSKLRNGLPFKSAIDDCRRSLLKEFQELQNDISRMKLKNEMLTEESLDRRLSSMAETLNEKIVETQKLGASQVLLNYEDLQYQDCREYALKLLKIQASYVLDFALQILKDSKSNADFATRFGSFMQKYKYDKASLIAETEMPWAYNLGFGIALKSLGINEVYHVCSEGCCEKCLELHGMRTTVDDFLAKFPLHPRDRCRMEVFF